MAKLSNLQLRKNRVRARVGGTADRPRMSVLISGTNVSVQLIDDVNGHTLAHATTINRKMTGTLTEKAAIIGGEIAVAAKKAKITAVVFDRNGRKYTGRLKALADAARERGLEF